MNLLLTSALLLVVQIGFAQQKQITGVVNEADGFPLPGASVVIKGTTYGTSTDMEGGFQISASVGEVLTISFLGYTPKEVTVGAANSYRVTLEPAQNQLDELVVVGYGVQKKQDVTGAISQIKGDAIENLVTPSFEQQLAGRASGVQVTTNGGVLGEAPRIRIRGINSINTSNSPLIVLDGVPMLGAGYEANISTNPLSDINPNDIESFEILKDGSATAIYGSRAANGVILITTKKGKKNSFNVDFSVITGLGSPMKYYDVLNGDQFTMINQEKTLNAGAAADAWAVYSGVNTDWQKQVFRNAASQADYKLGVSGGTDKGRYYLSLGYSEQEGAAITNKLNKYNIRASVEQDLNKWLTVGAALSYNRNDLSAMNKSQTGLGGIVVNSVSQLPNVPVYDKNNPSGYNTFINSNGVPQNYIGYAPNNAPQVNNAYNLVYALDINKYNSQVNRTIVNTFANVKLFKGLTYRFQFGYDKNINTEFLFWSPKHGDGYGYNGLASQYSLQAELYNVQNILNYNVTLAEKHNIGATAVYEVQKNTFNYFNASGRDMTSDYFDKNIISNAFATQLISGGMQEDGIKSYVGRVTYNYNSKYFLQGSIRRDGISKLSKDTRWENLIGYSAGWQVANEEFWDNMRDVVNEFKIRGSYAETGNTGFGAYAYQGLYSLQNYGNFNGIGYSQFGNDRLRWETSKKYDLGVDLGFLSNRVRFTVDYFQNTSNNMIMDKILPSSLGIPFNLMTINAGKMVNKGVEFDLTANVINTPNFNWDINANLTLQKNRVDNLPDGQEIVYANNIVREGESLNALYGLEYYGVNNTNGYPVYVKGNGTLVQKNVRTGAVTVYDPANPTVTGAPSTLSQSTDRKVLGHATPTYYGGITNTFKYKNFDLNFLFRFSGGNKIYNQTRQEMLSYQFKNNSTEILGRWQSVDNPGDGKTPILIANQQARANEATLTSRFLEKGDFILLDNLQIGYSFDKNLLERINLQKARVFVTGQNLWMITDYKGIDPEMISAGGIDYYGVPRNRIITLGVNVGF
ncbi:SusC/RagA family TonB-linked outer membrane protein [Flavobacterium agricola]|nr:TonB-dependent receptor [Flavobacterium agricola]